MEEGNTGPCPGRLVYGAPSMLPRFVMDRRDGGQPGGEAAPTRGVTSSPATGFSTLEEVSGEEIEANLPESCIAPWRDGRQSSPGRVRDRTASWDLRELLRPPARRVPAPAADPAVPKPAGGRRRRRRIQLLPAPEVGREPGTGQPRRDGAIRRLPASTPDGEYRGANGPSPGPRMDPPRPGKTR